jgi:hypothetical protein
VHELSIATGIKTRFAMKLASEPVTSTVFADGKLMFVKQSGVTDLTPMLPPTLTWKKGGGAMAPGGAERLRRVAWMEVP